MQLKQQETSLLVHRPRKRRNFNLESKPQEKSQNLKALHNTLLCQNSYRKKQLVVERASVSKLLAHNRSVSRRQGSEVSKEKERPMNFYINIQRLKNLRITQNKDQQYRRSRNNFASNVNLSKEKGTVERRSELLKRYNMNKRQHQSQQQLAYQSAHRISKQRQAPQSKARNRYKTEVGQEVKHASEVQSKHPKTNSVFKRAAHQPVLKDRTFIEGYLRGKQLGRGGFSKVWEGFNFKTKTFYAVKEIDTTNKYQTHLTEIWFGNFFFENGQPRKQYSDHEGINSLIRMYNYSIVDPRAFIVYENCNGSLGNMLYDIYEEDRDDDICEDDKLYMIKYKPLYNELRKNTSFIKTMIYQIAQALDLLSKHKIVHSDIKTENILLNLFQTHPKYGFKLIDYGSSFVFENLKQYKLATPEYMCPELLNYILHENKKTCKEDMLGFVKNYENTSAIDVWGLGCILIQLIHGLPLWLSNKTKILINGKYETKRGLFAVNDRSFAKILDRQLHVVQNFDAFLRKQNNSGIALDDNLKTIIKRMLIADPLLRIRPYEIIAMLDGKVTS